MRLYLSSYRLGSRPDYLVSLLETARNVGLILNACDSFPEVARRERLLEHCHELAALGLRPVELDLRQLRGADAITEALQSLAGVWIPGGNVFVLRQAMFRSEFDIAIFRLLNRRPKFVYAGSSAGAVVAGPTLRGFELVDDVRVAGEMNHLPLWDGLGIVPYAIAPHYRSNHHESEAIKSVVVRLKANRTPFLTLRDGQAIVIHDGREQRVG